MRVQGGNAAAVGPMGALPVPVPMREEPPFAHVLNANRALVASDRVTGYGPLALGAVAPSAAVSSRAVPGVDAARAYARAPAAETKAPPGKTVSVSV